MVERVGALLVVTMIGVQPGKAFTSNFSCEATLLYEEMSCTAVLVTTRGFCPQRGLSIIEKSFCHRRIRI